MKTIKIIWLIFCVLFLFLGCFHLYQSKYNISTIDENIERKFSKSTNVKISGTDADKPLQDKIVAINNFIAELNKSNKFQNIAAAVGYFLASLTSLFSISLSKKNIYKLKNNCNKKYNKYKLWVRRIRYILAKN